MHSPSNCLYIICRTQSDELSSELSTSFAISSFSTRCSCFCAGETDRLRLGHTVSVHEQLLAFRISSSSPGSSLAACCGILLIELDQHVDGADQFSRFHRCRKPEYVLALAEIQTGGFGDHQKRAISRRSKASCSAVMSGSLYPQTTTPPPSSLWHG